MGFTHIANRKLDTGLLTTLTPADASRDLLYGKQVAPLPLVIEPDLQALHDVFRLEWDVAVAVALTLTLSTMSPSWASDAAWWSAPLSEFLTSSGLHISVLDYKADTGLQVTAVSTALLRTGDRYFSIGIGYDDMVSTFQNPVDGSTSAPPISEGLFLVRTPCDKRFQFTLQITS